MNITKQTIERMAHLSRLPITADDGMVARLTQIMEYMDAVKDTEVSEPLAGLHSVLREDRVRDGECPIDPAAFTVPKAVL